MSDVQLEPSTADAKPGKWIALLGRRDSPTDGIEDYCTFLGRALARRGVELKIVRVNWDETGWYRALRRLSRDSVGWRGNWVLLQYTALSWSRRGFPVGILAAQEILCRRGARCAVTFHEPARQSNDARWIGRLRGACQDLVVRRLYRRAAMGLFADSLDTIPWLPREARKAVFIPIGANIPQCPSRPEAAAARNGGRKTIAVFSLTCDSSASRELDDISFALRSVVARDVKLRLVLFGRGTSEAKDEIARAFQNLPVDVLNLGLCSAEEISRTLSESDTLLCVRGTLSPRRGTAIAGIACGLPVIGYTPGTRIFPMDAAGVHLVPYGNRDALAEALAQVLLDSGLNERLRAKSMQAYDRFFSWDVIAGEMICALRGGQIHA
jgi:glycosyltransferase involved in cell wall biosynthesis